MKHSRYSPGARLHRQSSGAVRFTRTFTQVFAGHPARAAVSSFVLVISVFTVLLALPWASADRTPMSLTDAALTATSAVTVTGLTSQDPDFYSFGGQLVLLAAIQTGGLGIVTLGAWLTLMVSRRLSLRTRLLSTESLGVSKLGEVPALLLTVFVVTLTIEALLTLVMLPVFVKSLGFGEGLFHAVFYSVSAFSNAGFVLDPNSLDHPVVMTTINLGVFAGALGFPVVYMLYRMVFHKARMNLHTRLTLEMTTLLLIGGALALAVFEWNNPATLGPMSPGDKLHHAIFASGMTRSGGFNTFDVTAQTDQTLLVTNVLMFIGGGSGSTAGGIKVTTLAVLLLAIITEIRGEEHIRVHRRELPVGIIRVAVAVLMAGVVVVLTAVVLLTWVTGADLETTLFEVLSAFGTVGLSTGLTAIAPDAGKWILLTVMFIGRVGTITFAAGLTIRQQQTLYRFPTERPIIG